MNLDLPLVTIIMPIRNEESFIVQSLGAVLAQDYPSNKMEILVADGMSDDATLDIIRSMPQANRVRIFPNPRRIQSAGLNAAIQHAHGKFIIRVDGHTIIMPDYVRRCVELLQSTGAQNVGGPMDPIGLTPTGIAIAVAGKSRFAVPTAFHVSQQAQYTDTVYMGAWPREVFEQIGGFDEHFGVNEDYELNYRTRKVGGEIYFSPEIHSVYYGRQTFRALARQYFRYGRSKVMTLRKHPNSLRSRQLVAPIFVAGLIVGLLGALIFGWLLYQWLVGVVAYLLINVFVSIKLAAQHGWTTLIRLPLVFTIIHIAWGLGFWVGLIFPSSKSQ